MSTEVRQKLTTLMGEAAVDLDRAELDMKEAEIMWQFQQQKVSLLEEQLEQLKALRVGPDEAG